MHVAADPLKPYLWRRRVLVVSAPSRSDPHFAAQSLALGEELEGQEDRELTVIRVAAQAADGGVDAVALRERLSLPPDRFEFALVGKDGGVALRGHEPISLAELFARIDAMPMRRAELRKRDAAGEEPA